MGRQAELICVGNELLMGITVNTNASYLSRELQKLGITVKGVQTVADAEEDILNALKTAIGRAKLIILCGGLGPTDDDITRETVAKAFRMPLELNNEVLEDIKAFFESRGREMKDNNIRQAMVPKGARVLRNVNGTAPGLYIGNDKTAVVLLPGPPHELQSLFETQLKPILMENSQEAVASAVLGVAGIGESELELMVKNLLYRDNPHCALYAKEGQVSISILAKGDDAEEAAMRLKVAVEEFKNALGDHIYTETGEDISEAVVRLLKENEKTVALAESCTGGMMAQQVTAVSGASSVFHYGLASYSDDIKSSSLDVDRKLLRNDTCYSSSVAAQMARGARRNGKSDYGVGITGVAGPTTEYFDKPVGLVYIAVCDSKNTIVKKFNFGDKRGRDNIRRLSVVNAFDMLRRMLGGMKIEGGNTFPNNVIADEEDTKNSKKVSGLLINRTLSALLIVALLGSLLGFGVETIAASIRKGVYKDLTEEYSQVILENGKDGVAQLKAEYPNAAGWLKNAEGGIDTVVVKGRGDDYYTCKDYSGRDNALGCCYTTYGTDLQTVPDNLVISAGASDERIMLGSLSKYTDRDYAVNNRWFCFYGENIIQYYRLVSVFYMDSEEGLDDILYSHYFKSKETAQGYIINIKMRSMYETGETLTSDSQFMTLVCDAPEKYEGCKLVVVAVADGSKVSAQAEMQLVSKDTYVITEAWCRNYGIFVPINSIAEEDSWTEWLLKNDAEKNGGSMIEDDTKTIFVVMNDNDYKATPVEVVASMVAAKLDDSYTDECIKAVALACASELKYEMSNNEDGFAYVSGAAPSDRITELTSQVINKAIVFDGLICWTPTFACSSGNTNSALDYYGQDFPYLQAVVSAYDRTVWPDGYREKTEITADALRELLEDSFGMSLSDDHENWITVVSKTQAGYITEVTIDGELNIGGSELFCTVMGQYSSCINYSWSGDVLTLLCYGEGEGVGMSIIGANKFGLNDGWDYLTMLQYYYQGTKVVADDWNDYYSD